MLTWQNLQCIRLLSSTDI